MKGFVELVARKIMYQAVHLYFSSADAITKVLKMLY